MRFRNQKRDLVALLRKRIAQSPTGGVNWMTELTVGCAVQDMETALRLAGLDSGVEPAEPLI